VKTRDDTCNPGKPSTPGGPRGPGGPGAPGSPYQRTAVQGLQITIISNLQQ